MSEFVSREQLIARGTYSEEIMSKAEEIAWSVHPRTHRNRFEQWPDWSGANMQAHFAGLAKMVLDRENEPKVPITENVWEPWALIGGLSGKDWFAE